MWLRIVSLFLLVMSGSAAIATQKITVSTEDYLLELYRQEKYQEVVASVDSILTSEAVENVARLYQIKADALYFLNDVNGSLENYLLSIQELIYFELDTVYLIEVYSHTGFCYKYLGKYAEALPYYDQALKVATAANDSVEISNQLAHIGTLYAELGRYRESSDYLDRAYEIDFMLNDSTALGYDLVNLGDLMCKIPDYDRAIEYYRKGLEVRSTRAGNHNTHILRLGKLSYALMMNGDLDSARKYIEMSIGLAKSIKDDLSLNKQLITKSRILNAESRYDSAVIIGVQCYQYFNDGTGSQYQIESGMALAEALIGQQNFERADKILAEITPIARRNKSLESLASIMERRSNTSGQLGYSELAMELLNEHHVLLDSLREQNKQKSIYSLTQEYQSKQQEQQIELFEAKEALMQLQLLKKKRETMALVGVIIGIILVGGYVFYTLRRKTQLKNQLLASEVNELRLKLKAILEFKPDEVGIVKDQINSILEEPLSEREFEILNLAISNKSNNEIAEEVFVSVNTVKFHLKNIYQKLGVSNRAEALKYAIQVSSN